MNELTQSRTASFLTMLLGIWVAISPIFISMTGGALTSVIIVGIIMALAGFMQLFTTNTVPSWVVGLAAIYLFITAFAYSSMSTGAAWNAAISAVIAFILAMWDGAEINVYNRHHPAT
jgi:hypothetical protein